MEANPGLDGARGWAAGLLEPGFAGRFFRHMVTHLASRMPSYSDSCLIKPALGRVMLRFCFT